MGQKVNPHGARVGVIFDWSTRWYAGKKDFANNLVEDYKLREMLKEKFYATGISRIDIERSAKMMTVNIFTGKPGMIIGRGGAGIEALKAEITNFLGRPVHINVMEIKQPDGDAQLVAENIAQQLEKRIGFRRAMKNSMGRAMRAGAKGIKISCAGRLGGAEIARTEHYHDGTIPLQTLRADIDYGFAEAATTYGRIGVKVWIYKGEVLTQTLRTTPRTIDTKNFKERSERPRRDRRDGDRRGGFNRNGGGFNRNGGRPQGGFNNNRPQGGANRPQGGARPAAPKEGGAN